jgi:hypothetical protein
MAIAPKTTSSEDRKAGVDRAFREGQGPTKIGGPGDPPVKVAPPPDPKSKVTLTVEELRKGGYGGQLPAGGK